MLDDVIRYLVCPYCGAFVSCAGGSLRCTAGHVFNIARQGYVSMLPAGARGDNGDTAAMVQARADFLAAGHYAGIATELAQATAEVTATLEAEGCVIDVGAGTGYYLAAVIDRLPDRVGLALDVSKFALRRAARAHERIGAVACDAWRPLPVADSAAVVLLNIFAPRNGAELRRIINPAGRLLVVTPTRDHLGELVQSLDLLTIDERKDERLAEKLTSYFDLVERWEHRSKRNLIPGGPQRSLRWDQARGMLTPMPSPTALVSFPTRC
jgi:SAM-dependent methyltransferase